VLRTGIHAAYFFLGRNPKIPVAACECFYTELLMPIQARLYNARPHRNVGPRQRRENRAEV